MDDKLEICELRIGSLVQTPDGIGLVHAMPMVLGRYVLLVSEKFQSSTRSYVLDKCKPVQITKEILQEYDFDIQIGDIKMGANYEWWAKGYALNVKYFKNELTVMYSVSGTRTVLDHVKYMHHLQNILNAMWNIKL